MAHKKTPKKARNDLPAELSEYLASIGSKGGSAGTGKSKKRGSKAYYRELSAKAAAARKKNARKRAKEEKGEKQ